MKICITGAAGGIGSTLGYSLFNDGHQLLLIDNLHNGYAENLLINGKTFGDFVNLDIRHHQSLLKLLNDYQIEAVIHLAAISSLPDCEKNPTECLSVNVNGTQSVLEACRKSGIGQCIFASTGAIYEGNTPDQAPFVEDLPINTKLWYPTSKFMAENICDIYRDNYGMNIPVLRFFNVFGPRQDIHRPHPPLINYLVKEFSNNRDPILHGDGSQSRDYVYVDDIVNLISTILYSPSISNTTFNVCTGQMLSVKDIAHLVRDTMSSSNNILWRTSDKLWDSYTELFDGKFPLNKSLVVSETNKFAQGSFEKASKILSWKPNTDLQQLIQRTVNDILKINETF